MKTKTKIFLIAAGTFFTACISSCTRPDRVTDDSEFCNSGQSVLTIDDSYINDTVKDFIYKPFSGSSIISKNDPKYNHGGKTIIIPFTFTNVPWNTAIYASVIRAGYFGLGNGSFNDYFLENSYGQFGLTEAWISSVVNVPFAQGDWDGATATPISSPDLMKYLCEYSAIPWAGVDADGDHNITQSEIQVIAVYAFGGSGVMRASTFTFNTNFGGTFTITNRFVVADCKRNDAPDKAVNPIAYNSNIAHELGHGFFGLPDRYGVSGICATGTTGPYDMMADNCSWKHLSIYDKMKIGWITPKILEAQAYRPDNARHCFEFPASETTPAAVVLWTNRAKHEFFIIENRYAPAASHSFESGYRDNGLAVWWASTTSDAIHLVSFRHWGEASDTYNYDDEINQHDAMFINKHEYGATVPIILRNSDNIANFSFRAISPAGAVMHAEL